MGRVFAAPRRTVFPVISRCCPVRRDAARSASVVGRRITSLARLGSSTPWLFSVARNGNTPTDFSSASCGTRRISAAHSANGYAAGSVPPSRSNTMSIISGILFSVIRRQFLGICPALHRNRPMLGRCRIYVENRKPPAFTNANAQQAHPAFDMVYLLQFDFLAA